jgi:uncharacterized membrane protein
MDNRAMDFSTFKTADWLIIVGGVMMLIAGFLEWFDAGPVSPNAFDFTVTGLIPWLLLVAAAVLAFLLAAEVIKAGATPWPVILLALTAIGAVLVVVRLIIGADLSDVVDLGGQPDQALSRSGGLWVAAIGGGVAAAGGVMMSKAAAGRPSDLPDLQKIRDAFKS